VNVPAAVGKQKATPVAGAGARDAAAPGGRAAGLRLVPARCCLCGLDDPEPVAVGEDFEYRTSRDSFLAVTCRRCGLLYLNPRPAESEMARIYPDTYHAFDFNPDSFGLVYRVRRWLEKRRLRAFCRGLPADARILDVGCGDGFHLSLLGEINAGWTLEGLDVDARAAGAARSRGLTVHQGRLEELQLDGGSFDMVLLIMTIEHLSDPVAVMGEVGRLLKPGGRVVIVTDNAASPDFRIFGGRHWGGYHFPRHFYLFTRATLQRLADASGLRAERIATGLSPVNWTFSVRNWLDDWGAPRWLVARFSFVSAPALGLFTLLDAPLALVGQGALLQAVLVKPSERPGGEPK
jgi:SAM-dependent methyltransferase